ncbi:MAG TPA: hypothetical protein VL688_02730 [Verrucomicrobiae bacterium]|jgi:hypothetical protein|nr:hypothetical protein [Verrucomicrobiae bacterium]
MAATKTPIRVLLFLLLFSFFFHPSAEARKKDGPQITQDLTGVQPYPHQWIEAKGKKEVSLIGQAYRPRPDLFVMELNSFPDGETEIKSVKLKTADGKVIEGRIRRLPFNFMPTARQHYANPQMDDAGQAPQQINGPAQEHS